MGSLFSFARLSSSPLPRDTPILDTLPPSTPHFFHFTITKKLKASTSADLLIKLTVKSGSFEGIYCTKNTHFPKETRRIWQQEYYCKCIHNCDSCYPSCANQYGGLCDECMIHDEEWTKSSHQIKMGGLALTREKKTTRTTATTGNANSSSSQAGGASGRGGKDNEPESDMTGYQFSLRLEMSDPDVTPGQYYVTILSAPSTSSSTITTNKPIKAGSVLAESKEDPFSTSLASSSSSTSTHTNVCSVLLEFRPPRGDPRAGNEDYLPEGENGRQPEGGEGAQSMEEKERILKAQAELNGGLDVVDGTRKKKNTQNEIMVGLDVEMTRAAFEQKNNDDIL